jgi:hypothetical protein
MESRERHAARLKQLKRGKELKSMPSLVPLMWTGCYMSCVITTVLGLLLGGAAGVLVAFVIHLLFWLLIALLQLMLFLHAC